MTTQEARQIIDIVLPLLKVTRLDFSKKHSNVKEWIAVHELIKKLRNNLSTNEGDNIICLL